MGITYTRKDSVLHWNNPLNAGTIVVCLFQCNTSLRELVLHHNGFREKGGEQIASALGKSYMYQEYLTTSISILNLRAYNGSTLEVLVIMHIDRDAL